jgi:molybdopterin/thiamine biosynthesis adenylyltransferase
VTDDAVPPRDGSTRPTVNADGALSPDELDRYSWQLGVSGLGVAGQERLRRSSVLVSRIGGVGGTAALYLAAAGVGRLVLAHAGPIRRDDLNRQILMSTPALGRPRIEAAAARLAALNPHVVVETVDENVSEANADRLLAGCTAAVGAAPLFTERLALNAAAVRAGIPLVDAAMYDLEVRLFTAMPGGACVACLCPEPPPLWRREFPVLGAVAGVAGALAAAEAVRLIAGATAAAAGRLVVLDVATLACRQVSIPARPDCQACGGASIAADG